MPEAVLNLDRRSGCFSTLFFRAVDAQRFFNSCSEESTWLDPSLILSCFFSEDYAFVTRVQGRICWQPIFVILNDPEYIS